MRWRRTYFERLTGEIDISDDDWVLEDGRECFGRIYRATGPQQGRWAWFSYIWRDGHMLNGGSGVADTGRAAREAVEARVPEHLRRTIVRPAGPPEEGES